MKQKRRWLLINQGYLFLCLFFLLCFFLPIGNYQCQPSHAFGQWRREKSEREKCPSLSLFFLSPTSLHRSLPNTDILKRVMENAAFFIIPVLRNQTPAGPFVYPARILGQASVHMLITAYS